MAADELLKSGLARRVGNGNSINVEQDPWLPCEHDPYIHTVHASLKDCTTSSLMSDYQSSWDTDLVKDIFNERDANLILTIPIQTRGDDSWFWRKEKLGHYSVKSAYALIQSSSVNSSTSNSSGFWSKLWNLKIPLKVKHFIWRAVRDCLPTKDRLRSRRVEVEIRCPVCNLNKETTLHLLVTCPLVYLCWQHLGHSFDVHVTTSFKDWVVEILKLNSSQERNKIFMVAW